MAHPLFLVTPDRLDELLRRRALGERPIDLAPDFDLSPVQVNGLIWTHRERFLHICDGLGVDPFPKRSKAGRAKRGPPGRVIGMAACSKKPQADDTPPRKMRRCLKCFERFSSAWNGERLCPACANANRKGGDGDSEFHTVRSVGAGFDRGYP